MHAHNASFKGGLFAGLRDALKSDAPLKDEFLAYDGSGMAGDPPDGKTLRSWHQGSPGDDADIVAEVEANKLTTFVVRESWHPRWHAYIDGAASGVPYIELARLGPQMEDFYTAIKEQTS